MSNYHSFEFDSNDTDLNRKATAQELATAPPMTRKQMTQIMADPDYKRSKLAQEIVAASLSRGLVDEHGNLEQPVTGYETEQREGRSSPDEMEAKKDTVAQMFRDPRYRTSATYRHEVQTKLAALTANDGDVITRADLSTPNQVVRTSLSPFAHKGSDLTVHKHASIQLQAKPTPSIAPAKPAREAFSE